MKILILFVLFLPLTFCNAQNASVPQDAQAQLDRYNDYYQPEYAELILDKDFYFAGEKIWYALFLSNQAYAVGSMSALAYVEIRDKNDSILIRQKIRCREGNAHGEIQLPVQLPTGNYKIEAFTLWMKNNGSTGTFSRLIPVINSGSPLKRENKSSQNSAGMLELKRTGPHSVMVNCRPGIRGELMVLNREEVLFRRTIESGNPVQLNFTDINCHHAILLLRDLQGKVIDEQKIVNPNINASLSLSVDQHEKAPRSTVGLSINLKDSVGNPLRGKVAVRVRSKNSIMPESQSLPGIPESRKLTHAAFPELTLRREMFVYPPMTGTLNPVNFSARKTAVPFELNFDDEAGKAIILASEMKKKILAAYGVTSFYETEGSYNLPANNSFVPDQYAEIPTLEDFIREIIPQIRVRKTKGEREMRVRNSDHSDKIYFFKGSPLILVDRFIETAEGALQVPVADIERIDVIWGIKEINSLGVFSLADNGVVSITTKSRMRSNESRAELFKNLHIPLTFAVPRPGTKERAVPLLFNPVYWNPVVPVNGNAELTFSASDELGDFVVEVIGFTESGGFISGKTEFKIGLTGN